MLHGHIPPNAWLDRAARRRALSCDRSLRFFRPSLAVGEKALTKPAAHKH